jgi:hypothetical protein
VTVQTAEAVPAADLERLAVDTVRTLAMDTIQKAGSGHLGTAMALAPAVDPADSDWFWFDRDRFVLSNGHASVLQYAVLHLRNGRCGISRASGACRTWSLSRSSRKPRESCLAGHRLRGKDRFQPGGRCHVPVRN